VPFAAINTEIATILSLVSGVGVVHPRERWTNDKTKLVKLYSVSGKINGWQVTRKTTQETRLPGESTRTYAFLIRGYYSFEDKDIASAASETIIQELAEAICTAFRSNPTLNGSCETSGPMQVSVVEPVLFSGYLCHKIELNLTALEQFQVTF